MNQRDQHRLYMLGWRDGAGFRSLQDRSDVPRMPGDEYDAWKDGFAAGRLAYRRAHRESSARLDLPPMTGRVIVCTEKEDHRT